MPQVVSLSFFRFETRFARLWAFAQMGLARPRIARTPDIGFWKLCGSGMGEGFDLRPNFSVYAILATWPDLDTAKARVASAPVFKGHRAKAVESWSVFLTTASVRGAWSGRAPFEVTRGAPNGLLAILTRATIKPRIAARFWNRVPNISKVIGADPNVLFKIGMGEKPLFQQITFSIWPDVQSLTGFARRGPHAAAISSVRSEHWFKEELYARFGVLGTQGTWQGRCPLGAHFRQQDAA